MNEERPKSDRPVIRLQRRNIPDEELIRDLLKVAESYGKNTVSQSEYSRDGKFGRSTMERRFGSWTKALVAAGLARGFERVQSDEELFENLLNVWMKLGRQPRYSEIRRPLSRWSTFPYTERFGTWNDALISFARFVDAEVHNDESESAFNGDVRRSVRRTARFPNLRLRWRVLQRDCFKCKCGRTPAIDSMVILHVDHILAWDNGGETVLDNLQTLCEKCNLGKGTL